MPCVRQDLRITLRGLQMDLLHSLSKWILIISSRWALFESSLLVIPLLSSTEKSICESGVSVIKGKKEGNVLPLSINEQRRS